MAANGNSATPAALPRGDNVVLDLTIIAATLACSAFGLGLLLLTNKTWLIVLILALFGAVLLFLRLNPSAEERVVEAFGNQRRKALVLGIAIALVYPFLMQGSSYALHLLIIGMLYSVLALALNFQLGSANIPNFATGASYGIGAYTSALLTLDFGVNFWLTLPVAALVATFFGFAIGFPSMRTRDTYLALVTIAFAVVVQQLMNNFDWTGGPNGLVGIPAPSLFGHSFASPVKLFGWKVPSQGNFYYLSLAVLALAIISARWLHDSRVGLAWNALRADELAAQCQGINIVWYKMLAFGVDAFLAAFAGTVYAFYVGYISPDNFTFLVSVTIMTMVIVGGMDNVLGVIVGAFLLTLLPEKLRVFNDYRLLFVSVLVILFLMLRPQGLFPRRLRAYGGKK